jgi:hypothetical protein
MQLSESMKDTVRNKIETIGLKGSGRNRSDRARLEAEMTRVLSRMVTVTLYNSAVFMTCRTESTNTKVISFFSSLGTSSRSRRFC